MALLAAPATADGEPVVGHWLGNNNNVRETGNWLDGIRPGRFKDTVGDVVVTNGSYGSTMIFDEGLLGSGKSLNLNNLVSISNVVFRGENIAQFNFPAWSYLRMEPGGNFIAEAGTGKVPYFSDSSYITITDLTEAGQYVNIVNDSTNGTLQLCRLESAKQAINTQYEPEFRFLGAGDIELGRNATTPNGYHADLNGSCPVFVFSQTNGATFKFNSTNTALHAHRFLMPAVPGGGTNFIEIATNLVHLGYPDLGDERLAMDVDRDTVLKGKGQLEIGYAQYGAALIDIASGCTLRVDLQKIKSGQKGGVKNVNLAGGGTLSFGNGVANTMEGPFYIEKSTTLETPRIGGAGAVDSPLGTNCVSLSHGGRLVYTGPGETTDRKIELRWGDPVTIEQAGTGVLNLSGDINIPLSDHNMTLVLANGTDSDAVISSSLANTGSNVLTLRKTGSGTWRLAADAVHTGTTTVYEGTLAIGESGTLSASPVVLAGGTLAFEGDSGTPLRTLQSLTLAEGTSSRLEVASGATVTLPAITRNAGARLTVAVGAGATLKFTGLAAGDLPLWISMDGAVGYVADDGTLVTGSAAADHEIRRSSFALSLGVCSSASSQSSLDRPRCWSSCRSRPTP